MILSPTYEGHSPPDFEHQFDPSSPPALHSIRSLRQVALRRSFEVGVGMPCVGKLNLSCDVIVVNHFSHQVVVFE